MKIQHILVIGSGPSALASVTALMDSKKKFDITLVDTQSKNNSQNLIGLKSHFGSTNIYDRSESDITHLNMKPVVWPSGGKGGFSRIWGAVIGEQPSQNFSSHLKFGRDKDSEYQFTSSGKKILDNYKKNSNPNWQILDHYIAVDPGKCIMCGLCLTGCPTDAIWNAGNEWSAIKGVSKRDDFRVTRIEILEEGILVCSSSGETMKTDAVFMAAGAIASSQILMRSNLLPNRLTIKDTRATFFPALRFPVRERGSKFALSQISAKINQGKTSESYIQLYPDSRMLDEPIGIHRPILKKIIKKVWKYFSPFMLSGILYESSENSPNLVLKMTNTQSFELSKQNREKNRDYRRIKRKNIHGIFKDFGIIPLFFLAKKGEAGESYHFGSIKEIIDFNSNAQHIPIRIVDASALPDLVPGPVTDAVMQNAKEIVRNFLKGSDEISN